MIKTSEGQILARNVVIFDLFQAPSLRASKFQNVNLNRNYDGSLHYSNWLQSASSLYWRYEFNVWQLDLNASLLVYYTNPVSFNLILHYLGITFQTYYRKPVNHTSWVAVVTPTDRPKSVRNRCLIELFCGVVCVVTLPFGHFCWCTGFCHRTESDLFLFLLLYCIG